MLTVSLLALFAQHTYVLLFCWVFCEQMGCPLPSAPLLVAAGALCSAGSERWSLTFGVVITACVIADSLWFQLGRSYGRRILSRLLKVSLVSPASLTRTSDNLARYNGVALLIAKFIPGVSTLAPPLSGHSGMSRSKFVSLDLIGSLIWALVWLSSGHFLLKVVRVPGQFVRMQANTGLAIALCLIAALLIWKVAAYLSFLVELRRLRVTPEMLREMLSHPEGSAALPPYVVDLRVPQDVLAEPRHIPNAIRLEPHSLQRNHQLIPRDREVVLYCSCPSEATSTLWAFKLRRFGIKRVRLLRGGMEGWREAGYVLQTTAAQAATP